MLTSNQLQKSCAAPCIWPGRWCWPPAWTQRCSGRSCACIWIFSLIKVVEFFTDFLLRYFCSRMRNFVCIASTFPLSTRSCMSGQNTSSRDSNTYRATILGGWNMNKSDFLKKKPHFYNIVKHGNKLYLRKVGLVNTLDKRNMKTNLPQANN